MCIYPNVVTEKMWFYLNPTADDSFKVRAGLRYTEKGSWHRINRGLGSSCLKQENELRVVSLSMGINLVRRK